MANALTDTQPFLPPALKQFLVRTGFVVTGLAVTAVAILLGLALLSYNPADPSLNMATDASPANWLGRPGAAFADMMIQTIGLAAFAPVGVIFAWSLFIIRGQAVTHLWGRSCAAIAAVLLLSVGLSPFAAPMAWPNVLNLGGFGGAVLTTAVLSLFADLLPEHAIDVALWVITLCALGLGILAFAFASAVTPSHLKLAGKGLWTGVHTFIRVGRSTAAMAGELAPKAGRSEPSFEPDAAEPVAKPAKAKRKAAVVAPKKRAKAAAKKEPQQAMLLPLDGYEPPPLDILSDPPAEQGPALDKEALENNARLLEAVLADFGVNGEIVKVRPGPVVTLYELEPAPGTKTSRVIGLADDIARSMSAVSVRIAVVPGRSVIGIEMPNATRETVFLREMLAGKEYEKDSGKLPLALGRDIGGAPILADLARMPHLLVAGTTGSGKSVAVNTMILSLLYRHGPDSCRFIMIDPKMLELSVYDGIPHLLAPVVTDASKAVVALKWAVREMEDRYRLMSQLSVRNIAGYNQRLLDAKKKGEVLKRTVQTGFDPETGKPTYEEQELDLTPLPFIVVVVDEMADLMLVAGKDVEAAIQRLAQMARAAGIHLIMATQRPSVDVITGTIKANFPTRISFQVTSKIDSRTILGEQGAEQLLGQGDMLYMAPGGRITRVHGPFVADGEVEEVVGHLKTQGEPAYVDSVTDEDADGAPDGFGLPHFDGASVGAAGGNGSGNELFDQAVAIVARERKASTSFIQRHLKIGYNRAAGIIDEMEAQGMVSKANHVGKREVLLPDHSEA